MAVVEDDITVRSAHYEKAWQVAAALFVAEDDETQETESAASLLQYHLAGEIARFYEYAPLWPALRRLEASMAAVRECVCV